MRTRRMVQVGLVRVQVAVGCREEAGLNVGPFLMAIDNVELAIRDMPESRRSAAEEGSIFQLLKAAGPKLMPEWLFGSTQQ
jgi:hypothetical protein